MSSAPSRAAKSGAKPDTSAPLMECDVALVEVTHHWQSLPDALKAAVLAVVRSHHDESPQALPGEPRGFKGSGPERPLENPVNHSSNNVNH